MDSLNEKIERVLTICQEAKQLISEIETNIGSKRSGASDISISSIRLSTSSYTTRFQNACVCENVYTIADLLKHPKSEFKKNYKFPNAGKKIADDVSRILKRQYDIDW